MSKKDDRARQFKALLEKNAWTQRALAKALDFSERQIRRFAAGTKVPRVVTYAMHYLIIKGLL